MGALRARLGPAIFAALLTVVVVTPIFGLRLERAGTRTVLVPQWHYVIWGCAIVFVWQLLRPAVATATRGIRLPALPALSDRLRPLALLAVLAIAFIWPFFAGRNAVDIATLVLIYVMLGLGLNIVVGFAGLLDLGFVGFYATGAYTFAMLYTGPAGASGMRCRCRGRCRRCSASCSASRCCACGATTWRS